MFSFRLNRIRVGAMCAASLWCAMAARAQEAIVLPPVERVAPIAPIGGAAVGGVALPGANAVGAVAAKTASVSAVQASGDGVATAVLEKLRVHELTPQEAWQDGSLRLDDVVYILQNRVDEWGGFYWVKDEILRRQLEALLAEHGGEMLENPEKLSPQLRLWLSDYYGSVRDARAVPLAESILAEFKAPSEKGSALAFLAVERLGWYYGDIGQPEKAAQSWLRMKNYQPPTDWWVPDSMMEAARFYQKIGQKQKAQELYAQVPQYGNGWLTGAALWDRAKILMGEGKDEAAQELLQRPIAGRDADQVRVGMLAQLSKSYYRTGKLEAALQTSQQALEQYESLESPRQDAGLENQVAGAEQVALWSERWIREPISIVCDPPALRRKLLRWPTPGKSITWPLAIDSRYKTTATISCDNPQVKVRFTNDNPFVNGGYVWQKGVQVEVTMKDLQKSVDATISVRSPQFPDALIEVPVHIEVENLDWD